VNLFLQSADSGFPFVASFDGNFSLVHKRSAGKSLEDPKHGSRVFCDDDDVQEFVSHSSNTGKDNDAVSTSSRCQLLSVRSYRSPYKLIGEFE
jgi:hypothetical protein